MYDLKVFCCLQCSVTKNCLSFDAEGNPYGGEIPYNSRVRLKYKLGPAHPVHGVSTYLEAVKVLEEAEMAVGDAADF